MSPTTRFDAPQPGGAASEPGAVVLGMPFFLRAVLCFTVAAVVDAFWALYLRRANAGQAAKAAWYAALLMAFGMFNTGSWLEDKRLCVAIIAGSFVGTYLMVRHDHKNTPQQSPSAS